MNLEAWLLLLEQRHPNAIELGLERCGAVYFKLGSPRPAKRVFTVAGTNGKGSTVAYIAAMCGGLGQRYGAYTSPHVFRFNERVSVMGKAVDDELLIRAFERVEAARGNVSLTYFEFTTLAGLLILHQSNLDCAVLEVGLGGRLDAVNLVDADCTVITPIGLDHQQFLGADLDSIAREKSGVIRPGIPVVSTQTNPPGPVLQTAKDLQAPLYRRGIEFDLRRQAIADSKMLEFSMENVTLSVPLPSMYGQHQIENLAAALAAVLLLNPGGSKKSEELSTAISGCTLPGRLQKVHDSPEVLLDVGHNELAAQAIAGYWQDNGRGGMICVLAMLADKSAEAVALALDDVCKHWVCAGSEGDRGQTGEMLAGRIKAVLPSAQVSSFVSLDDALENALSSVAGDQTILIFGSFTTASCAVSWLRESMQRERPDTAKLT